MAVAELDHAARRKVPVRTTAGCVRARTVRANGLHAGWRAAVLGLNGPMSADGVGAPTDGIASLGGLIPRARLLAKLRETATPVVLVVAGAGYGKTTLLAQWSAADARPSAWLSLTERHDDPAVLLTDVVRTLGVVEPFDPATRRGLNATTADFTSVLLPRVERAIASRTRPFLLVIDDVHVLRRASAWAIVQAIADRIPAGSQVALAGRVDPSLALARMRADRRMTTVAAPTLVMTKREGSELFREAGLALDSDEVGRLVERTEGWPVGLYLASLALREQADAGERSPLFAGDDRLMAEYLRDEVMRSLPPRLHEFLVNTSVLDELSGPLCDAVLQRSDSAEALEGCARDNLLLVPLDRRGEWYRYHHLFRDMLRFELRRRDPALERELHDRASRWYEDQADADAAIGHAIAAGDAARVDALVFQSVPMHVSVGRTATVERWLEPFTPEQIAERPALTVSAAWMALTSGDMGAVSFWAGIASAQDPDLALPDGAPLGAAAALLRATVASDGIERMREDAALSFALDRPGSPYRSVACYLEGAALRIQGRLGPARNRLEEGAAIGKLLAPASHAHCLGQLALVAVEEDDWPDADRRVAELLEIVETYELSERPAIAGPLAVAAWVRSRTGDGGEARTHAKQALFLLSMLTNVAPWIAVESRLLLARASLVTGDVALARVLVREGANLVEQIPDADSYRTQLDQLRRSTDAESVPLGISATPMTPAELRVLRYLPTHLTFAAIADELFVSRNTVKTQAISIYRKLGVSSRDPAVASARRLGLLEV
jgi:LuxR family transcriptional regulator, maltose regulon positive regulatory protein